MHIVDIKAKDNNGRTFQIELQLTNPAHLPSRMLHNMAQIHADQISKGDTYNKVMPTIAIWLVNGDIEFSNDYYYRNTDVKFHFTFCDLKKKAQLSQDLSLYLINLHRWQKPKDLNNEDFWLYFLLFGHQWKQLPEDAKIPQLEEAMAVLEEFSEKEESYLVYQSRLAASIAARSEQVEREQMRKSNAKLKKNNQQIQNRLEQTNLKLDQTNLELDQSKQQIEQMVIGLIKSNTMSIEQIASLSKMTVEQVKAIKNKSS